MDKIYRGYTSAFDLGLQLFAAGSVVNGTTAYVNADTGAQTGFSGTNSLSSTMKTYYSTELLENARPDLMFAQFAKKQPLPANKGRTVEWRKWNTLPNATMLTEGVIPTGQKLGQTTITTALNQLGMFVAITDLLDLHAVDNVLLGATEELGASQGDTQDKLVRNLVQCGTNVLYCDTLDANGVRTGTPAGRYAMKADNNRLTPDMVNKTVTMLKKLKAPMVGGKYIALIHPSVTYDLRASKEWNDVHKYASPDQIFTGEIGELHGVRFIESVNAKIDAGKTLFSDSQSYLTVATYSASDTTASCTYGETSAFKLTVDETLTAAIAEALVGRLVHLSDTSDSGKLVGTVEICGASTSAIWLKTAPAVTPADGDVLYPGEGGDSKAAGQAGVAVYSTVFMGLEPYGIIDPDGGGLEMIVKDKSQVGGPLEQYSTAGYKFEFGGTILYEERMVRVESCSTYSLIDEDNT